MRVIRQGLAVFNEGALMRGTETLQGVREKRDPTAVRASGLAVRGVQGPAERARLHSSRQAADERRRGLELLSMR